MSKNYMLIQQLNRIVRSLPNSQLYEKYEVKQTYLQHLDPISMEKVEPICLDDDEEISNIYDKPTQYPSAKFQKTNSASRPIQIDDSILNDPFAPNPVSQQNQLLNNNNTNNMNNTITNNNNNTDNNSFLSSIHQEISINKQNSQSLNEVSNDHSSSIQQNNFILPSMGLSSLKTKKSTVRMNELKFDSTPQRSTQTKRRRSSDIDFSLINQDQQSESNNTIDKINKQNDEIISLDNQSISSGSNSSTRTIQNPLRYSQQHYSQQNEMKESIKSGDSNRTIEINDIDNNSNNPDYIPSVTIDGQEYYDLSQFTQLDEEYNENDNMTSFLETEIKRYTNQSYK